MAVPSHTGRSPEQIIREESHLDSSGFIFRSISWLDYFKRVDHFPALLYSCIEGRFGIEYLMFEELIISTGARLSRADYRRCVNEGHKLYKLIDELSPDHEMLKQFTAAVVSLDPLAPNLTYWDMNDLRRSWGILSEYVHWMGSKIETTEKQSWRASAANRVEQIIWPLWEKITSGRSGLLHPKDMKPKVFEVWEDFKNGKTDEAGVRIRLQLIRPLV